MEEVATNHESKSSFAEQTEDHKKPYLSAFEHGTIWCIITQF
jgi:hypothetical protein